MSALPPAMEGTIMRTGFAGYVSAAYADVPAIAPATAMQITAIRFMIASFHSSSNTRTQTKTLSPLLRGLLHAAQVHHPVLRRPAPALRSGLQLRSLANRPDPKAVYLRIRRG